MRIAHFLEVIAQYILEKTPHKELSSDLLFLSSTYGLVISKNDNANVWTLAKGRPTVTVRYYAARRFVEEVLKEAGLSLTLPTSIPSISASMSAASEIN